METYTDVRQKHFNLNPNLYRQIMITEYSDMFFNRIPFHHNLDFSEEISNITDLIGWIPGGKKSVQLRCHSHPKIQAKVIEK